MIALLLVLCTSVFAINIKIEETKKVPVKDTSIDDVAPSKLKSRVTRHVYGLGHVADVTNGVITYYHQDRLGSTRLATDEDGEVVGEFKSLPFGQIIVNDDVRFGFTGKEQDSSGDYYFGARYYDPDTGRFISVDPVRDNHAFAYVSNNPMNYIDPTGMFEIVPDDFMGPLAEDQVYESNYVPFNEFVRDYPTKTGPLMGYDGYGDSLTSHVSDRAEHLMLDIPVICGEQTCADMQIMLYFEYMEDMGLDFEITTAAGEELSYFQWEDHPMSKKWGSSREEFLRYVFVYTDTGALVRNLEEVKVGDLREGDLILQGRKGYGHTMSIFEVRINSHGEKEFVRFAGSDPAIDARVYSYPYSEHQIQQGVDAGHYYLRRWSTP